MWRRRKGEYHFIYTYRKVKRQAKRDGRPWRWTFWPFRAPKPCVPATDQQQSPEYENELKEAAEQDIALFLGEWHNEDESLKKQYCDAYAKYLAAKKQEDKEVPEAEAASRDLDTWRSRLLELEAPPLSPRWALFWLFVLGVGEFFLNASVFEILGGGRIETYLTALGLGVAMPLLGHFTGHSLRQEHKGVKDKLLIAVAPVVAFLGLYALSRLRGLFATAAGREMERVLGVEFSREEFTAIFLLFNIVFFFVAVGIAYAGSYREGTRYRQCTLAYRMARQRFVKEAAEARAALKQLELAERLVNKLRAVRSKRYQRARQRACNLKETAEWLSTVYRAENLRHRRDGRPPCFDAPSPCGSITLPPAWQREELEDWDCGEVAAESSRGKMPEEGTKA